MGGRGIDRIDGFIVYNVCSAWLSDGDDNKKGSNDTAGRRGRVCGL